MEYRKRISNSKLMSKKDVINISKEYLLGNINSQYYKNLIVNNKKMTKTNNKEKEDLLTPNKIQNRIKELFNYKKNENYMF